MTAYLNIGSNQGDRAGYIGHAVALILESFPQANMRLSDPVCSVPWGFDSENEFINVGMALDFAEDVDPFALLDSLQEIERTVSHTPHRNADGSYRDRDIDIDIIAIDRMAIDSPRLTIPHPFSAQREFVMQPLRQLAPSEFVDWLTNLH